MAEELIWTRMVIGFHPTFLMSLAGSAKLRLETPMGTESNEPLRFLPL